MSTGHSEALNNLHLAVHGAADAHSVLAITDAKGVITYVNDNFVRLSCYSRDELIGKTHKVVNSGAHSAKFFEKFWRHISSGKIWHGCVRNRTKNGAFYWLDTTVAPITSSDGEITGYAAIRTDITDLVLERNLHRTEAKKAQAANQAKSEFLAMMSHELRTPMNAIMGSAQVLQSLPLDKEQNEHISTMIEGSKILMTVLNDILDFSKIGAGKLEIHATDVDVARLTRQLYSLWLPMAKKGNIDLACTIDEDVPAFVRLDGTRLRQILYNLLSNAIKFTANGQVRVVVSLAPGRKGVNRLRFRVSDTGIGISRQAQSRLFGAFEQADKSTTRRFGGTGLGLAIARNLARLMDGDISVESEEGAGACFTLELSAPLASAKPGPAKNPNPDDGVKSTHSLRHLSIFAAEDNALNRKVLAAFLKPLEAELVFAEDGKKALQVLQSRAFDVVLMDIQMPGMSGIELTKELRILDGPNQHVPVIAMTANALQGDRERYLDAGMNDYVPKPIDVRKLFRAIMQAVNETAKSGASENP